MLYLEKPDSSRSYWLLVFKIEYILSKGALKRKKGSGAAVLVVLSHTQLPNAEFPKLKAQCSEESKKIKWQIKSMYYKNKKAKRRLFSRSSSALANCNLEPYDWDHRVMASKLVKRLKRGSLCTESKTSRMDKMRKWCV